MDFMNNPYQIANRFRLQLCVLSALTCCFTASYAGANPQIPFYGGNGSIIATPHYPIVGETAAIQVVVGNSGDAAAANVQVKVSFNDWGVTFQGWQEMGTVTIPLIPAGGSETVTVNHVFETRTHTCVEATIVGADENINPNDDRGQINLEVIHSGETFSYGVPIRNNGDEPVALLICGQAIRADGQIGDAAAPCKGDEREPVLLEPGEEILFPVEIHVAPGEEVTFRLDAFNLLGGDPLLPQNHNHVELHIIGTDARTLKKAALIAVQSAEANAGTRPLRNRLAALGKHIQHALDGKSWKDANRLNQGGAASVFAQEIVALDHLQKLLETNLSAASKGELNAAALQLTDADRILAQTANNDSGGNAEATALIGAGDRFRESGEYKKAVTSYSLAWHRATH